MTGNPDALIAALMEIERHVGSSGWDQPARLFALVPTAELIAAEPTLAAHLTGAAEPAEGQLSAIEQEDFRIGDDLGAALAGIFWPETVNGVALVMERTFLSSADESDLPVQPDAAARLVANHPNRHDIRVVVGATRNGAEHGVARLRDQPDELLGGRDLVPGLGAALARTLV